VAISLRGTNRGARGTVVRDRGLATPGGGMTGGGFTG